MAPLDRLARLRAEHGVELGDDAWIALVSGLIRDHEARMHALVAELPLAPESIVIFGRPVETPRLVSFHGEPHARYGYSGRVFEPRPWTPGLSSLRDAVEELVGVRFDCVLVNHYRSGDDAMGWHADDEPELGPAAPRDVLIASLSLGAPRRFVLRHRRRTKERRELSLGEGSLLVMGGATQHRYQHAVPRTAKPVGPRTNLTFRLIRR
ncbi:MAG: alpha-ketoglutarate-dependent dioxygenase AlkB [Sandaracinaceae bacterium]|nr:alpha-ketoglutarate-dependent dioxygenase AlkB [Sandaracinaceae bacterium]